MKNSNLFIEKNLHKVRLAEQELHVIFNAFHDAFMQDDQLWIFGSRTLLDAKGGDIDIFIKTDYTDSKKVVSAKLLFLKTIFLSLEEQKIDVVIQKAGSENLPIYEIAQRTGARLL